MEDQIRIDKWLWAVRVYKTRSIAAEACKKSKVTINNVLAKASKTIGKNDSINVTKKHITYSYIVKEITQKRISAKLVPDFLINITPKEELNKLLTPKFPDFGIRERGAGRPTKKERRTIDRLQNNT